MYRSFFGLRERPFDLTPNPRFLVLTERHREALSNLHYAIASRRGVTLLLGEAGTGKTTLIRTALQHQPDLVHAVHLDNPALTRDEFVEMLAARFDLSAGARASKSALLLELERLMGARQQRGESTVLIIDEAQSLPLDLLEEIRLLANIETHDTKLLSVILAGQPELGIRLNENSLRQLKQRVALRCELRPLSLTETMGYVAGRLAAAGGVGARIFTREAVMLMHERAAGIPRTISVIADNALVAGFALGRRPVARAIVEEVCRDLDFSEDGGHRASPITPSSGEPSEAAQTPRPTDVMTFDAPGSEQPEVNRVMTDSPESPSTDGRNHERHASGEASEGLFSTILPKRLLHFLRQRAS